MKTALMMLVIGCGVALQSLAADASSERVVYSFGQYATDSEYPVAGMTLVKSRLYGTANQGGALGEGTVFFVDLQTGAETVLHSFGSSTDGRLPQSALLKVDGKLYGTTVGGGSGVCSGDGCGTLFSIDVKTGRERVLHSFNGGADGYLPEGDLVHIGSMLYGTTYGGGEIGVCRDGNGCGTVFSYDLQSGMENVLYSFQSNGSDGVNPSAGLVEKEGTLYGTTFGGGAYNAGTLFSLNLTTGAETVLHSFGAAGDGMAPQGGLTKFHGILYGTTSAGGLFGCSGNGCGTIFSFDSETEAENVLYAFCSQQFCPDGSQPQAGLIAIGGKLFGTANYGGGEGNACGTAFTMNLKRGAEKTLHVFDCSPDGQNPQGRLIDADGTVYGTTVLGGNGNCSNLGCGTVFAIVP